MNLASSSPSSSRHDGRSLARSLALPASSLVSFREGPNPPHFSIVAGCNGAGGAAGIDTLATRNLDTGRRPKDVGCRERRTERRLSCDSFLAIQHAHAKRRRHCPSIRQRRDENEMVHHRTTRTRPQFLACDAVELGRTGAAAESRMSSVTFRTLKRFLGA